MFAPKFRRKILYSQKREIVGRIPRKLCEWKGVEIIRRRSARTIYMQVAIPPKLSVSIFMGSLKGKSGLELYDTVPELKNRYRNRVFWCRGYYVDTAGKNAARIQAYIRQQLEEDNLGEQLSMFGK